MPGTEKNNMPEGNLKPDEVANLDPYNTREPVISSDAKVLLDDIKTSPEEEAETSSEDLESFHKNLIHREKTEWEKILGSTNVKVDRPPLYITPQVLKQLDKMGLTLRYIPDLGFRDHPSETELSNTYPNWRRFEDLVPAEVGNWNNKRNLKRDFWYKVRTGKTDQPRAGFWVAVEEGVPDYSDYSYNTGTGYKNPKDFPLTRVLGVTSRQSSYNDAQLVLDRKTSDILASAGLDDYAIDIRIPSAIEYNLLMNRDKISANRSSYFGKSGEWTSTGTKEIFGRRNLIMGFKTSEGASDMEFKDPNKEHSDAIGYRVLLEFRIGGLEN